MVDLECIPFGAGHADEGICLLLRMGPYRILCDCGLADLEVLTAPLGLEQTPLHPDWPAEVVLCSHAHADHARGLLTLHQTYPELPIYTSDVTAHLLPLNWPDEPEHPSFCQILPWRSPLELLPGLTVELFPAGHLPGAAACLFTYTANPNSAEARSYTLLYTGDFLLSNSRLVDGLPLSDLRGLNPDVLILEGSFGTARYPHRRQQENQLSERMIQAVQQGMAVMLPVPVLGLAQELLMLMRSHHYFTGKDLDIWVEDSIAQGCDAYLALLPHLPPTVQNFAQHQPLFWDERIRPRVKRLKADLRSQIAEHPCIVLVPETANIEDYCSSNSRPWLLLCPEHRPREHQSNRYWLDQQNDEEVASSKPSVNTEGWDRLLQSGKIGLDTFLLSEHCDGSGTTQLIHNLRPQHVVFIHGSPACLDELTSLEELASRYHLHSPRIGKRLELPVGEDLIQLPIAATTDVAYEGELHEVENQILVTLPEQLLTDPRWRAFGDTGLIEASWQGEALVLRSLSQRELLMHRQRAFDPNFRGCANCRHYRHQRCWNQQSSLYGFKIAADGSCPAFEK